jgi:hypothetical protein
MLLAILTLLVGVALGQRFTVLVLLPAILVTLCIAVGVGMARAQTAGTIALGAIAAIVCLQIGYLLGLAIRQVIKARASRLRSASFTDSPPARRPAH